MGLVCGVGYTLIIDGSAPTGDLSPHLIRAGTTYRLAIPDSSFGAVEQGTDADGDGRVEDTHFWLTEGKLRVYHASSVVESGQRFHGLRVSFSEDEGQDVFVYAETHSPLGREKTAVIRLSKHAAPRQYYQYYDHNNDSLLDEIAFMPDGKERGRWAIVDMKWRRMEEKQEDLSARIHLESGDVVDGRFTKEGWILDDAAEMEE
jgi:hypothetical protein